MTTTLLDLPLGKVHPHPSNPRRALGDLTELVDSIRHHGVLEPIVVAPNANGYVIIAGARRHAASKVARTKTIPAIIREDLTEPSEQLAAALAENLQRVDLTPLEEARGYIQLLAFDDYDVARVARVTGRAARTVKLRVGLARLPEAVLDRVEARQIPLEHAEVLAAYARQPEVLAQLESQAGTANFAFAVQRHKLQQARDRAAAKVRKDLAAAGVTILEEPLRWDHTLAELGLDPAGHAACPGHVAWINYRDQAVYGCADPVGNGHTAAHPSAPTRTYDAAAADRQRARDDADAAKAARREWLRTKLLAPSPASIAPLLPFITGGLVDFVLERAGTAEALGSLLALNLPAGDDDEAYDTQVRELRAYAGHSQARLLALAAAVVLLDRDGWDADAGLLRDLEAAGYELSDQERQVIADEEAERAALPAADLPGDTPADLAENGPDRAAEGADEGSEAATV